MKKSSFIITNKQNENQIKQFDIHTKIDWASFVYHIEITSFDDMEDYNRQFEEIVGKITWDIIDKLSLDIDQYLGKLLRDSSKSVAITRLPKSIKVELEGKHFPIGKEASSLNYLKLKKTWNTLNRITEKIDGKKWTLSRLDIARTVPGITIEQLLPDNKNYYYCFRHKKIDFINQFKIIETSQIKTSKVDIIFYRKDIELKNKNKELEKKQTVERDYSKQETTRAEVRLKSGSESLMKALQILKNNKKMTEYCFCKTLLGDVFKKRKVKTIPTRGKNKSRWPLEKRWEAIFSGYDKKLKVTEETLRDLSCLPMPDMLDRELNRFKSYLRKNDISGEDVARLLEDVLAKP